LIKNCLIYECFVPTLKTKLINSLTNKNFTMNHFFKIAYFGLFLDLVNANNDNLLAAFYPLLNDIDKLLAMVWTTSSRLILRLSWEIERSRLRLNPREEKIVCRGKIRRLGQVADHLSTLTSISTSRLRQQCGLGHWCGLGHCPSIETSPWPTIQNFLS
jgi:hypothetical protein